jgi:hypothetical protein
VSCGKVHPIAMRPRPPAGMLRSTDLTCTVVAEPVAGACTTRSMPESVVRRALSIPSLSSRYCTSNSPAAPMCCVVRRVMSFTCPIIQRKHRAPAYLAGSRCPPVCRPAPARAGLCTGGQGASVNDGARATPESRLTRVSSGGRDDATLLPTAQRFCVGGPEEWQRGCMLDCGFSTRPGRSSCASDLLVRPRR